MNKQAGLLACGDDAPLYSGGTAPDLHRLPFSPRFRGRKQGTRLLDYVAIVQQISSPHHDSIPLRKKE